MKTREPIWWLPLLWRSLVWGLTSAALLIVIFSLFIGVPLILFNVPRLSAMEAFVDAWKVLIMAFEGLRLFCGLFFITGAASGLCAPPTELKNPLRSPFFGKVTSETILFSLVLCIFVVPPTFALLESPPVSWLAELRDRYLAMFMVALIFAPSLALAINRALRAARK